jgi:selenocysteine lyase/cysteine desulfurase
MPDPTQAHRRAGPDREPAAPDREPAAPDREPAADREKLAALRAALPATRAGIYLDTGTCGPIPAESADAMSRAQERELALGRATREAHEELMDRMAEARAALAAVLGTDIDRVALTHSTTEGIGLAVGALDWRPGDRALTTNHEHPGLLGPLAAARDRYGVEVRVAQIGDGGDDDRTLVALGRELAEGGVRLVALSHVLWTSGAVLPVAEIVRDAHAHGAVVALDGAQAGGAIPLRVDDLGAEFYAVSGQKWLLGPQGTGALVVRPDVAAASLPAVRGSFSVATPNGVERGDLWPDARRFEAAGFHAPSVVGLARSAGWLAMYVGLPWAHARAARLAHDAAVRLNGMPGVALVTPLDRMATLVTFRLEGWPAERVAEELARRVFATARPIPGLDAVRISVGFFTTDEELRRALDVVALLARHTPASLPARPAIDFLERPPA